MKFEPDKRPKKIGLPNLPKCIALMILAVTSGFLTWSFHNYEWPEKFEARIKELRAQGRPLICTEYMARGNGSTFDTILPIAKREHVAAINWGLVAGKTQTYLPWDSWERPYVVFSPPVWFHDIFRPDGTPYRTAEVDEIRALTRESNH